jgi:hypothetical protein
MAETSKMVANVSALMGASSKRFVSQDITHAPPQNRPWSAPLTPAFSGITSFMKVLL